MPKLTVVPQDSTIAAIQPFLWFMDTLASRWQDEQGYEPFADYRLAMQRNLPQDAEFAAASSWPFSCRFRLNHRRFEVRVTARAVILTELR